MEEAPVLPVFGLFGKDLLLSDFIFFLQGEGAARTLPVADLSRSKSPSYHREKGKKRCGFG